MGGRLSLESDRTLLDSFRRGDRAAMTEVFRAHIDDVARTLLQAQEARKPCTLAELDSWWNEAKQDS